jgi:hypothetical protein
VPRARKTISLLRLAKGGQFDELRQLADAVEQPDLPEIFCRAVTDYRSIKRNAGHQRILEWCLDQRMDVSARAGWLNESIVGLAARNGNGAIIASIQKRGMPDDPFSRAAVGDFEFLKRYATQHRLAELRDANGFNLLFPCAASALGRSDEASLQWLTETCRFLLEQGVEPAHVVTFELPIFPAWLCAAYGGNADIMRRLLDRGGLPHDHWHQTLEHTLEPHQRSGEPHYAIAELILARGFDVNQPTSQRRTLLHGAANRGTLAAVRWLLEHGADPNALDGVGRTPLHVCAERNTSPSVARLLVAAGADPQRRDAVRKSALDYAREHRRATVVDYLGSLGPS